MPAALRLALPFASALDNSLYTGDTEGSMSDMSSEEIKAIKILSDQAIGVQSILYRTFQEELNADKNNIKK
jgi:hypothetical protein